MRAASTDNRSAREVAVVVEEIESVPSVGVMLERLDAKEGVFVLGDFSQGGPGCYSYLGLGPVEVLEIGPDDGGDPIERLDGAWSRYRLRQERPLPAPFVGGWVGYLSYDLKGSIERLPDTVEHDIALPLARFCFYDHIIGWDHRAAKGYLLALHYDGELSGVAERLGRLRQLCRGGGETEREGPRPLTAGEAPDTSALIERMERNITEADYLSKVAESVEYIKAGDIFEVNLSRRLSRPYGSSAECLYEYLIRHNPAGYSVLLMGPGHAIVSASPELFLSQRGRHVVTRPIKGTIARGADEQQDQRNRQKLVESEKDRAELNMIIDLERNDLGRVCSYGSVKVIEERVIEAHPTVFHASATISGQLRDEVSAADLLRATFPCGSISGAPKIRAMEIIDELEPTGRSVYTGSIGWLGVNGDMDLNIAIRTIILTGGQAYVQAGGAIVADSDPQSEYDETVAKAAALVRALYATEAS